MQPNPGQPEPNTAGQAESPPETCILLSRTQAMERALIRLAPGVLGIIGAYLVVRGLNFRTSAVDNRIIEYCVALLMIPIVLSGVALVVVGIKWAIFSLWPGRLAVTTGPQGLLFELGPFGREIYPPEELNVQYLFEISMDAANDDDLYESLLPEEEQMATKLPRISHHAPTDHPGPSEARAASPAQPPAAGHLERRILYFSANSERELVVALQPFVAYMRRNRDEPSTEE